MQRSRSIRPKKSGASLQDLLRLVRNLGAPSPEEVDAVRETLGEAELDVPITEAAVTQFIEQACELCVSTHRSWEQCPTAARVHLRGFSLSLLAMVSAQILHLDHCFRDFKQCEQEVKEAAERVKELRKRNYALYEQGRAVLQMVAGAGLLPPRPDGAEPCSDLLSLAEVGRKLLADPNTVVRSRTQLYHFDLGYIQALIAASSELSGAEAKASDVSSVAAKQAEVERALRVVCPLLAHVSQVFDLARHFDPRIPPIPKFGGDAAAKQRAGVKPKLPPASTRTPEVHVLKPAASEPRRVERLAIPYETPVRAKR